MQNSYFNESQTLIHSSADLASHCRVLLHDRPRHRRLIRYAVLYPLYVLSEIAIVSTDIAELIGSAIGLCLIFPSIPLWVSVLITASDVLIFLLIGDPSRGNGRPVKVFEYVVMTLVCCSSFHVEFSNVHKITGCCGLCLFPSATSPCGPSMVGSVPRIYSGQDVVP